MKKLLVLLVLVLLAGCDGPVEPAHVLMAEELCGPNGGWKSIEGTYTLPNGRYLAEIRCNNEARFEQRWWPARAVK